jgi:hypothetical protein
MLGLANSWTFGPHPVLRQLRQLCDSQRDKLRLLSAEESLNAIKQIPFEHHQNDGGEKVKHLTGARLQDGVLGQPFRAKQG